MTRTEEPPLEIPEDNGEARAAMWRRRADEMEPWLWMARTFYRQVGAPLVPLEPDED